MCVYACVCVCVFNFDGISSMFVIIFIFYYHTFHLSYHMLLLDFLCTQDAHRTFVVICILLLWNYGTHSAITNLQFVFYLSV